MPKRALAYAQLLRLPNAFSAVADIAMAGLAAGGAWPAVGVLIAASVCLYLSGMAFNDFFDRHDDAKTQAFRPIPSGRVAAKAAAILGTLLMLAGVGLAFASGRGEAPLVAGALAGAILLYDGGLKRTPLGPIAMGLCRFLNVLLGLSAGAMETPLALHLAGVVGLYIVGVTWFARTEETTSDRRHLAAASVAVLAALVVALALPTYRESSPVAFPYLLVAFGFFVGMPLVKATRSPKPAFVQAAVKRCILGLVLLDAVLATLFVGWPGLAIGLLILPARWLGKRVYST
jgi:4-hydroxybenzoate polyprenyltransferase